MSAPSSPHQQATGTLHRHFNLSVATSNQISAALAGTWETPNVVKLRVNGDLRKLRNAPASQHATTPFAGIDVLSVGDSRQATVTTPFAVINVLPVGDRGCAQYRDYCAQYRDHYPPVASHSRTSSHSSLPDLIGCSSSSEIESSDDELPELEFVEHMAVECRKCRPFPASHGCRPCPFSWPDLRPAARRQHDLCVQIISNDYCPLVEGGTRDFVMYCGARCYSQRRRADTGYDVLDYVKSMKRFKAKPSVYSLSVSAKDYLRHCHTNMSVHVKAD